MTDDLQLTIDVKRDPFLDDRLRVANLPTEPQTIAVTNPISGATKDVTVALFRKAGEVVGARRAISEVIKWMNVVTGGRVLTIAADLSESVNLEHGSLWGHYDPEENPARHASQGGDSGGGERVDRDRTRRPERLARSGHLRGRVGVEWHLRRLHAADVPAGPRVEPAKSGQQVPDGRAAHPGGPFRAGNRRRRPHALRHLLPAGVETVPARPDHQPELLGLQRRGRRLLRGRRDRGAREEGRGHRHRSGATGLPGGRPQHVRRHGHQGRGQGPLCHPRLRARHRGMATWWRRARARRSIW